MDITLKGAHPLLTEAGFTDEQVEQCYGRYLQYPGDISYDDWCKAYAAMNSTKEMDGVPLDANVVVNAMLGAKKPVKKKIFSLGSYKKQRK